ncbi:retrovirus-related Pol polyprotein from transposon 412 [Trichonephila clavipes]|nr:retrovirus-related Pol polyprotein from transposon 412 [Trichonephila clavipes]
MYKSMTFGLRNAPATFQRLVDQFRNGLPNVNILVYLEDIVVLSETFEQHIEDLRMVFDRLKKFELCANREKLTPYVVELSNKSKVVTATVQYSPFCAAVDESIDEPQPQSNMAVSESNQFNFVDNHRHKRQKFMTDFQQLDDQASKRTTDSVTKFLVCTMQPYNLVDRKEFINMVKVLNPRYSLPGKALLLLQQFQNSIMKSGTRLGRNYH